MKNCLGNLEAVWHFLMLSILLFLLDLEFLQMILFYLFEIVIAAENHFFTSETKSCWVCSKLDFFDLLRSISRETLDKEVRELEVWEQLEHTWVVKAWHDDPLG